MLRNRSDLETLQAECRAEYHPDVVTVTLCGGTGCRACGSLAVGEKFAEAILDCLEAYAPNLRKIILAKSWITPLDMEREYGLTRGDVFHGAIFPYQMFSFRPVPGWARYRTPVERLYLCGAGAHPGGGVLGAPGHNAAMAVLEDWPKLGKP